MINEEQIAITYLAQIIYNNGGELEVDLADTFPDQEFMLDCSPVVDNKVILKVSIKRDEKTLN